MNSLSLKFTLATNEAKKLRWCYDGALKDNANKKDLDEIWSEYILKLRQVGEIQRTLEKIGAAKIEVAKAEWWMNVGVRSEEHIANLVVIFPHDSLATSRIRHSDSMFQSRADYSKAKKILDDLEIAHSDFERQVEDSWANEEDVRIGRFEAQIQEAEQQEQAQQEQAQQEQLEKDQAEVQRIKEQLERENNEQLEQEQAEEYVKAWTEAYIEQEKKNDEKRKKFAAELKEAEDIFCERFNDIKRSFLPVNNQPPPEWSRIHGLNDLNKSIW